VIGRPERVIAEGERSHEVVGIDSRGVVVEVFQDLLAHDPLLRLQAHHRGRE
jgi:hypothetical protein